MRNSLKLMKFSPPQKSIPELISQAKELREQYTNSIINSVEGENFPKVEDKVTIETLGHIKESLFNIISKIESIENSSYSGPALTIKAKSIQTEMQDVLQRFELFLDPTLKKSDSNIVKLPITQTAEQLAGQLKAGFVGMNRALQGFISESSNQIKK
ncbi:hypothetical protein HK103_006724 [Boothiomyces macroporosus]|uniref:Uncharacterized protein n=1 Tax=Boothiomyces macroporosus TaxID=261099 RepID=A0AAD5Y1W5_9FUNG|nr:hypothetical protein HK103_006724 [Boothiomyces macroporosus]